MHSDGDRHQTGEGEPREHDSGLASLVIVARIHGIAGDTDQLEHRFRPPAGRFGTAELVRAARALGLKARAVSSSGDRLQRTPLPALARWGDGYVVVAGCDAQRVLVFDPVKGRAEAVAQADFQAGWDGTLVLITRRHRFGEAARRFGLGWFVPALLAHRRLLGEVLLASFFLQLFALATPLFFQIVVDKVLVHRGLTTLDVLAIGLLALSLFEVTLGGLRTYVFSHTTNRVDVMLGAKLFRHLLALPVAYFEARRVGDTVARVRELENIRQFLTGSVLTVTIDVLFTLVFLVVMWQYSVTLTVVVLCTIPLYALLSALVTPVLRSRLNERFETGARNQAFLVETVSGVETLKAAAVEPQSQRRWEEQLAAYVGASFRAANLGNIASQIASLIQKTTVVLILWIGARQVIDGALTVGELVAFNMLAARVSGPILRLVQLWQELQQALISMQRLGDVLDAVPEAASRSSRSALPDLRGRISLEHVSFRYRPDAPDILTDVDLDVQAGRVIGIVGPSGSGKSTLTKLIQRLHVPQGGRVLVDGVDLAMIDPAWLRRRIGVVLQDNVLFSRSVRENIALSDPSLPMEAVVRAAKLAGAHEFIVELPEGYDTEVGERGTRLSGGQRQRIAIARALAGNPRILIMDEATSSLDYDSERTVHANLRYISRGRTVFIIAHRLTAVRAADEIVVLERGRIVERGTHEELLRRAGHYAHLHACQRGDPMAA